MEAPPIDIDRELLERRLLLFAPKNEKDLRIQYPRLNDYPELKSSALHRGDLLFAWFMRCSSSPFADTEDEVKLERCIELSYDTVQQRLAKLKEFTKNGESKNGKFPEEIKGAFKRMSEFNLSVEARRYANAKITIRNAEAIIAVDASKLNPDLQADWAKRAKDAWALLEVAMRSMDYSGIATQEEVLSITTEGALKHFRNSN